MSFKSTIMAAAAAASLFVTGAAQADEMSKMMIQDAYARASTGKSTTGAAFMAVVNHSAQDDRLISVRTDAAARAELHTHKETGDGVMQMVHVEEGFAIPAGETHLLKRGGDHVMLMGLTQAMKQGDIITLTLVFETAGEVVVEVPVDLERKPGQGGHSKHTN
ncbi:MAG: copper-binding protein [Rhodobacteraceae bacterium]|nr:MAG: copper-binding protein [Paracoccaceae bacterium]